MNSLYFLKKNNIKITEQRLAIVDIFIKFNDKFLSVDSIYKELMKKIPSLNISTLYRNIEVLEKKNLLHKILDENGSGLYSLISIDDHHHHIICEKCGSTTPIEYCPLGDIKKKLKDSGFKLTSHKLEFYGICEKCSSKKD